MLSKLSVEQKCLEKYCSNLEVLILDQSSKFFKSNNFSID